MTGRGQQPVAGLGPVLESAEQSRALRPEVEIQGSGGAGGGPFLLLLLLLGAPVSRGCGPSSLSREDTDRIRGPPR